MLLIKHIPALCALVALCLAVPLREGTAAIVPRIAEVDVVSTNADTDGRSGYNEVETREETADFETEGRSGYNKIGGRDEEADFETEGRSGYNKIGSRDEEADFETEGRSGYNKIGGKL